MDWRLGSSDGTPKRIGGRWGWMGCVDQDERALHIESGRVALCASLWSALCISPS
jgi:hypothetical protein